MAKEEKIFSTRDIYLASTLIYLKFPMINISFQYEGLKARPIGYFEFNETPALLDACKKHNQGLVQVEPRMYVSNLQALKAEVMNFAFNPSKEHNRENSI